VPESQVEKFLSLFSLSEFPTWEEVEVSHTESGLNRHELRNKWVVYMQDPEEYEGEIYIENWFLQRDLYNGGLCWGELFMDDTVIFDFRWARRIEKYFEGKVKAVRISDYLREQDKRMGLRA